MLGLCSLCALNKTVAQKRSSEWKQLNRNIKSTKQYINYLANCMWNLLPVEKWTALHWTPPYRCPSEHAWQSQKCHLQYLILLPLCNIGKGDRRHYLQVFLMHYLMQIALYSPQRFPQWKYTRRKWLLLSLIFNYAEVFLAKQCGRHVCTCLCIANINISVGLARETVPLCTSLFPPGVTQHSVDMARSYSCSLIHANPLLLTLLPYISPNIPLSASLTSCLSPAFHPVSCRPIHP